MGFLHKRSSVSALWVSLTFIGFAFFSKSCETYDKRSTPDFNSEKKITDTLAAKIELGRHLFYDKGLSLNFTKSCASCHNPVFAFSDGYRTSTTALGQPLLHNSPSLVNTAFYSYYDWADTNISSYAKQIKRPLYNEHPIELGFNVDIPRNIALLQKNNTYSKLFNSVYGPGQDISAQHIEDALIAFVHSITSFHSPYDRFMSGDSTALTPEAAKGKQLFFSARLQCGSCHREPLFTNNDSRYALPFDSIFFNTGLYNTGGNHHYPAGDEGLFEHTRRESDIGRFKTPSLRNVAVTAPYFHDGSAATLSDVIDIYSRGGRNITTGPAAGDGKNNKYKDRRIHGFAISPEEKKALIAFLYSLTDSAVLSNPAFTPLP